jgi:hypothetical protein
VGEDGDSVGRRRRCPVQKAQVAKDARVWGLCAGGRGASPLEREPTVQLRSQYRRGELAANIEKGDPVRLLVGWWSRLSRPHCRPLTSTGRMALRLVVALESFFGDPVLRDLTRKRLGAIDPQSLRVVIQELLRRC